MSHERRVTMTVPTTHVDDRGELFEMLRRDDQEFVRFGQVYVVRTRWPGVVRAWHRHAEMWDHFCIVHGAALFQFVDADPGEPAQNARPYRMTLSDRKAAVLHVPPGVWHGWMALEPNTLLLSVASEPYCGDGRIYERPDEERLPASAFDACWKVEAR